MSSTLTLSFIDRWLPVEVTAFMWIALKGYEYVNLLAKTQLGSLSIFAASS